MRREKPAGKCGRSPSTLLEGFSLDPAGRGGKVSAAAPFPLTVPRIANLNRVFALLKVNVGLPFTADSCSPFRLDARELRLRSPADSPAAVGIQIRYVVLVLTQFKGYK